MIQYQDYRLKRRNPTPPETMLRQVAISIIVAGSRGLDNRNSRPFLPADGSELPLGFVAEFNAKASGRKENL